MYIRKKSKTDSKTQKKYYTYQLVESVRTVRGPRQKILLSIGLNQDLTDDIRKMVSARIEEVIQCYGDSMIPYPKEVEELAQLFAKQLLAKQALKDDSCDTDNATNKGTEEDFAYINLNSVIHSNCRTVGLEHITLETIKKLQIDTKLKELGFSNIDIKIALGMIVGKLVKPASERATHLWLKNQSALSELIDANFHRISEKNIYKISDKLFSKKKELENHLTKIEDDLFELENSIIFFDITNTYLEGSGKNAVKAKRGKSKEKRSDCPLVALGLAINNDGFPRKSQIYEGNISEPSTLQKMVSDLKISELSHDPIIVLDAGFATEENLEWLRKEKLCYIVCARNKMNPPQDIDEKYEFIQEKQSNILRAVFLEKNEDTGELSLCCHSTGREKREKAIKNGKQEKFENELLAMKEGLTKKGCTKNYKKILEKIGRLKERYSKVARFYTIKVTQKEDGENTEEITFELNVEAMEKTYGGFYYLRSWGLEWNAERLWKSYTMLTQVEDGFRALKSDLGLRPIFHQKESRIDGHLFITLLAYHVLRSILYQLSLRGIEIRWQTLKGIMATQTRVTSSFCDDKGKVFHVRSSTVAEREQKEIYEALGISPSPSSYSRSFAQRKS